jgi:hypothetical protein
MLQSTQENDRSELISQSKNVRKTRKAFRILQVQEFKGHQFVVKFFAQFAFCSFCDEFLWFSF